MVEIDTETNVLALLPYEQCKEQPTIKLIDDKTAFNEQISKLNAIIANNIRLAEETSNYYSKKKKKIAFSLQPYSNKMLMRLFMRGFLPSLMSKKKKQFLANMIMTESHRDIFTYYLIGND